MTTTCLPSRRSRPASMLAHLLECAPVLLLLLLLLAPSGSGFAVHHRHPHPHHLRHHGHHHPMSPESTVSPEHAPSPPPNNAEAVAVDALLEAVKAADLNDAAWGPAASDADDGVPLFMKLLLRDTEMGAIFSEFSQSVAAPVPGSSKNKTLASCVQPSRVTVGRAGAMVVEFPKDSGGSGDGGWWLVLSTQPGAADLVEATVSVYLSDAQDLKLLAAHPLPNATFLAVDVTKAMLELGGSWPRLVVDVTSPRTAAGAASAATTLEVAGWERGPLLVRALDWGEDATSQGGSGMRVWSGVPEDLMHPPRVRTRRRSHRKSATTTEGPAFTSAENPLQSAARSDIHRDGGEQDAADGDAFCHLESWTVSLEDLGWPFIVAPLTFNINFCAGRCPPSALGEKRYNASMNAIARTYIKLHRAAKASAGTSADDGANIPAAQCVPIRFKPIALLMRQNDGSIDLFTSYDLSADRCGCR